jgi:hypothetical protein
MPDRIGYKVMPAAETEQMLRDGLFRGSPADIADDYIHLSSGSQLVATLDNGVLCSRPPLISVCRNSPQAILQIDFIPPGAPITPHWSATP